MSSFIKEFEIENLHSSFSDKLTIDGPHLKLDWSLRNQLIKKLNEPRQLGMKAMVENRQMIAALVSLPVLAEDAEQPPSNANQAVLKFLKEIDYVKHRLGMFDARSHNIVSWFKKFELCCQMFEWSAMKRVEGLMHLMDNGLERVVYQKAESVENLSREFLHGEESKYNLVKNEIIDLVTDLTDQPYSGFNRLRSISKIFYENKFTVRNKKYWLELMVSYEQLAAHVEQFEDYHLNRLVEVMAMKSD